MLSQIRAFLIVSEEGSINRAAERLRLSQSALSRQMQALEHEIGGALFERTSIGVQPTAGGLALQSKLGGLLADYDRAVMEVRQVVRGEQSILRIGYLPSAAKEYLNPALKLLRTKHPGLALKLLDLSPGEQIAALRAGKIDAGLLNQSAHLVAREFYVRDLATIQSIVALPEQHPLATKHGIRLAELKREVFVKADDAQVPDSNRRFAAFCWKYGRFRPRTIGPALHLANLFELLVNENAVAVLPLFARHHPVTGVVFVPLLDKEVTWKMTVAWQRGKTSPGLRTFLNALLKRA